MSVKLQVAGLNTALWLHIDNPHLKNTSSATSINMNILYIDDMIKKSFDVNDEFKGLMIALSGKNNIRSNMWCSSKVRGTVMIPVVMCEGRCSTFVDIRLSLVLIYSLLAEKHLCRPQLCTGVRLLHVLVALTSTNGKSDME